jgi:hypothetical protein
VKHFLSLRTWFIRLRNLNWSTGKPGNWLTKLIVGLNGFSPGNTGRDYSDEEKIYKK